MKRYEVQFWYNTDLRATEEVEAYHEVMALAIACTKSLHGDDGTWVDKPGFFIKIVYKGG